MARLLGLLILLAVVAYGIWPYYSVFRLGAALEQPEPDALAPLVDLPAIQSHYKERIGSRVGGLVPQGDSDSDKVIGWLAANLQQLGDAALDQAITLKWVRDRLVGAVQRANDHGSNTLLTAVDFAFFESWDRFVIRIGRLGEAPTFIVLSLQDGTWRATDITG
jgi:hypothetical protein